MGTSTFAFASGSNNVQGYGQKSQFTFVDTWFAGETWTVKLTATNEGDITLGAGRLVAAMLAGPTSLRTVANRVYLGAGSSFYFSDNVDPSTTAGPVEWEEQGTGAGQIAYVSQYGTQDTVVGFATQQGRLAVFGRYSIQIWAIDADPDNFSRIQILTNIGCRSALTIQQLGDLDVLFLDDSGIRSLRTKEVNLNADPVDIGSAIDSLVTAKGSSFTSACGVVEPVSKRYWCFIQDTIYVLSYFRQNKIAAWSTYLPTYLATSTIGVTGGGNYDNGGHGLGFTLTNGAYYTWTPGANEIALTVGSTDYQTASTFLYSTGQAVTLQGVPNTSYTGTLVQQIQTSFTPTKFVVYNGLVYIRASDGNLYHYTESTYDNVVATVITPYMDDKRPGESKYAQAIDVAMSGAWSIQVSTDPVANTYQEAYASGSLTSPDMKTDSSFAYERAPYSGVGTHFSFKTVSSNLSFAKATLGGLVFHYNRGGQP